MYQETRAHTHFPQVQEQMAAQNLVALLVGQLLGAADTLEPALRLGALQLLQV